MLNPRIHEALRFADQAHAGQARKGTEMPYIVHPIAVACLVMEYGGTEAETMAALLHDALEDGGAELAPEIERLFGIEVLSLVRECSDCEVPKGAKKPPWKERKLAYLEGLPGKSPGALLVTACDKLHNLTALVRDVSDHGSSVWDRFSADKQEVVWYYQSLVVELERLAVRPARELRTVLDRL